MVKQKKNFKVSAKDADILQVKLDLANQAVIKSDSRRTRPECEKKVSFVAYLELMLTYYCKLTKIKYKQGLNEVIII